MGVGAETAEVMSFSNTLLLRRSVAVSQRARMRVKNQTYQYVIG